MSIAQEALAVRQSCTALRFAHYYNVKGFIQSAAARSGS
jgi:hypothetical protein